MKKGFLLILFISYFNAVFSQTGTLLNRYGSFTDNQGTVLAARWDDVTLNGNIFDVTGLGGTASVCNNYLYVKIGPEPLNSLDISLTGIYNFG